MIGLTIPKDYKWKIQSPFWKYQFEEDEDIQSISQITALKFQTAWITSIVSILLSIEKNKRKKLFYGGPLKLIVKEKSWDLLLVPRHLAEFHSADWLLADSGEREKKRQRFILGKLVWAHYLTFLPL